VPDLITSPPHTHAGTSPTAVALLSARECVEPKSYRATLDNAQAPQWQATMQQKYSSLMHNGTWELVDLPPCRVVVNNMWIYKVKSVRSAMRGVRTHASRNEVVRLIQVPPQKSVPDWNILCI
jgi:hypothetical protein